MREDGPTPKISSSGNLSELRANARRQEVWNVVSVEGKCMSDGNRSSKTCIVVPLSWYGIGS